MQKLINLSWIALYTVVYVLCVDRVYKDGSCELLIKRSIDKLLAEHVIRKFPGQIVLQTFELGNSRAQPYCICTSPIGPIGPASRTPSDDFEPHGSSMYTLSMVLAHERWFEYNECRNL